MSASPPAPRHAVVSSEDDLLVLVNAEDQELGTLAKSACHDGDGVLHRAFSLFVFNAAGETLLQRRHADKRLWPGYWSNGCCSHPRAGEVQEAAVRRRAAEELGLAVRPRFVFKFSYHAAFRDRGSERELCSVFVARTAADPVVNRTEIADWRWLGADALDAEIDRRPAAFTPWLKLEWIRLRRDFAERLD
jgi:isopentenyl-diphosphate delta-isomerase